MFTPSDLQYLAQRGTSQELAEHQLATIVHGFPYLPLEAAASVGHGIVKVDEAWADRAVATWNDYLAEDHRVMKFVPASGAASRMFKNLFAFIDAPYDTPDTDFERIFFGHIDYFAFFPTLDATCLSLYGLGVHGLMEQSRHKDVVRALLGSVGMNYGKLPKGLLQFHTYTDSIRTPLEEHLVEGALYAADNDGRVHLHFTVSPEHRPLFEQLVGEVARTYELKYGVTYDITFSEQKPSTDTIAANPDGTPFHDAAGHLVFRPGGHGALIENLSDLRADIVFVKNIDNVVPDRFKDDTVLYKQILAGILVGYQRQIFTWLRLLDSGTYTDADLTSMLDFLEHRFCCVHPQYRPEALPDIPRAELVRYLHTKLNRPIRVCGMVPNVGEPGGGPFLARGADGSTQLQILESSQIDQNDARSAEMFSKGTHFNPVDLVCGICDYSGQPFSLADFVDPATGFISSKSKDGRELLALELPGLWNGAMSDWLTLFVEVPLTTFNPVKTVNDLLREQHQL